MAVCLAIIEASEKNGVVAAPPKCDLTRSTLDGPRVVAMNHGLFFEERQPIHLGLTMQPSSESGLAHEGSGGRRDRLKQVLGGLVEGGTGTDLVVLAVSEMKLAEIFGVDGRHVGLPKHQALVSARFGGEFSRV